MDFTRFFLYIQDVVVYSVSLNKKNYFAQNSHKNQKVEDIPTYGYILHFLYFYFTSIMLRLWDLSPLSLSFRHAHAR